MTNEQLLVQIKMMCVKVANTDLSTARIQGSHVIVGTKKGAIEVRYTKGKYMILDFSNTNFAYYAGSKKGAVEFLAENYVVLNG